MQEMIRLLLSLDTLPKPDAADGLAVAVCHAHTGGAANYLRSASGSRRKSKRWTSVP